MFVLRKCRCPVMPEASDALEQELQAVVNHLMWMLGPNSDPSEDQEVLSHLSSP